MSKAICFLTLCMYHYTVAKATKFYFRTNSSTLQVYEGDMLEVCVDGEEVSTSTEVKIVGSVVSNKGSAIAGSDFSPRQLSLQFSQSLTPQTICGHFSIIQDGLDEETECFNLTLQLNHGQFSGNPIFVCINACRENDINLQMAPWIEGGLSTVEYCFDNHWVTLCDSEWTKEDANVTCRQAGYSKGNATASTLSTDEPVQNILGTVPQCSTRETQLAQCMKAAKNEDCHTVLVKCGSSKSTTANKQGFSTGEVVAMTAVPCIVVFLALGALLGALLQYGISRALRKPQSWSQTQDSLPVYEDIDKKNIALSGSEGAAIELKLNVECGPSKKKELEIYTKPNQAYRQGKR